MTTPPTNWNTKLVVKVDNETVTPISKFNPTFSVPVVPLHSLESDNVAFVSQPATFTFTMEVQASGPVVAKLTDLALKRIPFTIEASQESGDDWTFSSLKFNDCFITSLANQTTPSGPPVTTISGICLQVVPTANV
jgi:hypothetical protein